MKFALGVILLSAVSGAAFFLFFSDPRVITLEVPAAGIASQSLPSVPEPAPPAFAPILPKNEDLPRQARLENPPDTVKAVYATAWSAGSAAKMKYLMELIGSTELNAIVIDIKDYSGFVSYRTNIPEVRASGAEGELRIARPNKLIKDLHDRGIYVIGRVSVFQDTVLAKVHPEWALTSSSTGKTWVDRKGLAWMDPAAKPVWDYNIEIARDALERGFDEINFDYIRFPSDGDVRDARYPQWDERTPMSKIINNFFAYTREHFPSARISADLFGLSTVNNGDLGIGQVIENAYAYFDYVSPMVYPSHYSSGFIGYQNPAAYPYEVVKYSLEKALTRLMIYNQRQIKEGANTSSESSVVSHQSSVKLRPWLQDFDLGAVYTAEMVRRQMQAVEDVLKNGSSSGQFAGWMLWDPENIYTKAALQAE